MKLRKGLLVLSLGQMGLAAGLLRWSQLLERVGRHYCDMPGDDPAFRIMLAVSAPLGAPLSVARGLWFLVDRPWNEVAWIAGVGLFWYWIAGAIGWRGQRDFPMPRGRYARLAVDSIFVLMALLFALMSVGAAKTAADWPRSSFQEVVCFGPVWSSELIPLLLAAVLYSGWCAILLLVFGRDFRRTLRGRRA